MAYDLNKLFPIADLTYDPISNRAKVADCIRGLLAKGNNEIQITFTTKMAQVFADDIDFAAHVFPLGVPQDMLSASGSNPKKAPPLIDT